MKRKIICILLLALIVGTIVPYAAVASNASKDAKIINNNSPPNAPNIVAPEIAKKGKWFKIELTTTDPDGDEVYYRYKYDLEEPSEWLGPFSSGDEKTRLVKVIPTTTITFKAQAKDIHGAESDWSSVSISISRSRAITGQFLRLLENYPNIYSLLKTFLSL